MNSTVQQEVTRLFNVYRNRNEALMQTLPTKTRDELNAELRQLEDHILQYISGEMLQNPLLMEIATDIIR